MAEERACPPGAPDIHLAHETRNKRAILAWKNIQLRLRPGESEAANLERHRPKTSRLNLDNAVVQRAMMFNVENVESVTVVFTDEELIGLQALDPDEHARVALMSNAEREVWKRAIHLLLDRPKKKAA
jgi:hypothetical protein